MCEHPRTNFIMRCISIIIILLPSIVHAQWEYKIKDVFGYGSYTYAYVTGFSDRPEHSIPELTLRFYTNDKNPIFYLSELGKICQDAYVLIRFDQERVTYLNQTICGVDFIKRELFMPDNFRNMAGSLAISKEDLFSLMEKHKKMYVNVIDQCDTINCIFPLAGFRKSFKQALNNL